MELNKNTFYAALKSRDPRFDGIFFTAVKTTGIYCRPVCPAVTPKLQNIHFYRCATAAEEAGFRPCLRCRPETSPGTPAWLGSSTSVSRALRLIDEGYLDNHAVEELALRLGLGSRHLNRLFREHLGSTPVALAQTRRAHFARNLLDQTGLSMAEVAFAAGFGSVRRFNTVIKKVFGMPPISLRQKSRIQVGSGSPLRFRLPYRPPYDWPGLLQFIRRRAIPGVELVSKAGYSRTISWQGMSGIIAVDHLASTHQLELQVHLPSYNNIIDLVNRVKRAFDCGADPLAIGNHLGFDPLLKNLITTSPGVRLPSAWDPFEMAIRAILGQQISVKGASTLAGRIVDKFGVSLGEKRQPGLTHLFPSPEELVRADLAEVGLTKSRTATIKSFSSAVTEGGLDFSTSQGQDHFINSLTQIKGIGPWTAHYVAMRALGEPDAFPLGDLGLEQAWAKLDPILPLADAANNWHPWRSYAAMHLWRSLAPESTGEHDERSPGSRDAYRDSDPGK